MKIITVLYKMNKNNILIQEDIQFASDKQSAELDSQ